MNFLRKITPMERRSKSVEEKLNEASSAPSNQAVDPAEANADMIEEKSSSLNLATNPEYLSTSAKIEKHNRCIDELKRQIQEKSKKPNLTCIEARELNCLQCCLQKELMCLRKLKESTIEMQANDPEKPWGFIPLSTTLEEDQMPRLMSYPTGSFNQKSVTTVASSTSPSACIQENLIAQNIDLESNRDQLKRDLLNRDKTIQSLTKKMQCLQFQLAKLSNHMGAPNKKPTSGCPGAEKMYPANNTVNIRNQLEQMSSALGQIQQELNAIQTVGTLKRYYSGDENCFNFSVLSPPPPPPDVSICSENNFLDKSSDSVKQDRELRYLKGKLAEICACQDVGQAASPEKIELEICCRRNRQLTEEKADFKNIVVEQQKQLNEYRDKYMHAQQRVIEQKCQMDNMEMNNKRVEEQINAEVFRIKKRFQDKLEEMAPLPKILENEQFRLAEMTKRNEELESKMSILCTELRQAKRELSKFGNGKSAANLESKCVQLCAELAEAKKKIEQLICEKHCVQTQLKHVQEELETNRNQGNRILARTKERCESSKDNMKTRIDQLEMELAKCRANAAICLADREAVIRQMKAQLSDLSNSFDGAQKQIRNLKNRMSNLSPTYKEDRRSDEIICKC